MSRIGHPDTCILVMGILYLDEAIWDRTRDELEDRFGPLNRETVSFPFDFTTYYGEEMGENLTRRFAAFDRPIDPGDLADIKHRTNGIEEETGEMRDGILKRSINLDPGTISPYNLVLASTKNAFHRVYLSRGIYAELTLLYRHGSFHPIEWTYPDYRRPSAIEFFNSRRRLLVESRKNFGPEAFHRDDRRAAGQ